MGATRDIGERYRGTQGHIGTCKWTFSRTGTYSGMQGYIQGDIEVSSLIGCDWEPDLSIGDIKGSTGGVRDIGDIQGIKGGHTGGYREHRGM